MRKNPEKSSAKGTLGTLAFYILFILFFTGQFGLLILILLAGGAGYYFYKKHKNGPPSGGGQASGAYEKLRGYLSRTDEPSSGAYEKLQDYLSRTDEPSPGVNAEMFSESERVHLASLSQEEHDEYLHHVEDLNALLSAGIIEADEYRDRLAALRQECR